MDEKLIKENREENERETMKISKKYDNDDNYLMLLEWVVLSLDDVVSHKNWKWIWK